MAETHSNTSALVLETKLHPPQIYPNTLMRPRLLQLLKNHKTYRLIAISAPTGYGKSTFLAMWRNQTDSRIAWVSLDELDNDVMRFWSTVVKSVTAVTQRPLRKTMSILNLGGQPALDALTTVIISDFEKSEEDITIILDDFHLIHDVSIHRSLEYVIKHMPRHVHLVIASRNSLPFAISRLRVQGHLLEIGVNELRFTIDEIQNFYHEILDMDLSDEVIRRVTEVTEGWVSGIQLAAMAMQDQKPSDIFIGFRGRHQLVAEFLNDEIFRAQEEVVQRFLLETSILNKMTEPLCSFITGIADTGRILGQLQVRNSFLIALDAERSWFRYHHLFADFLRHRLTQLSANRVRELHRKAAHWFSSHGFMIEAIDHAILAEDFTFAVSTLEHNCAGLLRTGELNTLFHWFRGIPTSVLSQHPLAWVLYGWILSLLNQQDTALRVIAEISRRLSTEQNPRFIEEVELELDVLRGYIALLQGSSSDAIRFFEQSVKRSPRYSKFFIQGVNLNTGEPHVLRSRLGMRGRLTSAFEVYTALRRFWKHSGLAILGYGSAVLGELHYEWNEFDKLDYFIPRGLELGRTVGDAGILVPIYLLHARYLNARGMKAEMWHSVDELQEWLSTSTLDGHWDDIVTAFKIRMWMDEGQIDEVLSWLDVHNGKQHKSVPAVGEYVMITLARALLYTKRWTAARGILGKLMHYAETEERLASKIEIALLQTVVHAAQKDTDTALVAIRQAVQWGQPENYQRTFLDEGEWILYWLRKLLSNSPNLTNDEHRYVKGLIQMFDGKLSSNVSQDEGHEYLAKETFRDFDSLTNREYEILKAIELGLTNAGIAEQFGLTVGTVKLYAHNIYSKLGVRNRTHAVAKARELNLL